MAYSKPDVIVRQEFQNLAATPVLETLQAVIIGPSYKKIKDDDASSVAKKIDYPYANESMVFNMPDMPADCIIDEESLAIRITNKNNSENIAKTIFKGNAEDSALLTISGIADRTKGEYFIDITLPEAIEAEVRDVVTISSIPYTGEYVVKAVSDDKLTVTIDIDDEDKFNDIEDNIQCSNISVSISSPGFTYDAEAKKFYLSGKLGITGSIYLSGKAFRRDLCNDMIIARASDLEDIFGKGEVNSDNPLALGMQIALANIGGGEDAFVAGIGVESDDVLGYQKAFEVLETKEVYAMVPLTTNLVVPQVLMAHVDAMSKPEEKHERVGIFSSPWMNRYIRAGQLMIQQEDGSYDFVKGRITTSGKPLDDNFICLADTFAFDQAEHTLGDGNASYHRVVAQVIGGSSEGFLFNVDDVAEGEHFEDGIIELTGNFRRIRFKSNSTEENLKIRVFMYGDPTLKAGTYVYDQIFASASVDEETHQIIPGVSSPNNRILHGKDLKALRVKVIDAEAKKIYNSDELPEGMSLTIKCDNANPINSTKVMTSSFDTQLFSVVLENGEMDNDRYGIVLIGLKANGTLKINRLVGGDIDPDVATFLSSGVQAGDSLVIIDKENKDATTYSGYKESRFRVAKAKKENELLIDAVWDEDTQDWDITRVFEAPVAEVCYRVESPVITNKRELAQMYANISSSYHDRRMTHIFAPYLGISEDGEEHQVPGYYAACAYAGKTQAEMPQQGFTNMSFAGFTKVEMTNDYFTESQLNIIASGGTAIFEQKSAGAMLTCRHQLTTNMDTIDFKEYTTTRILDYIAKSVRASKRPFIGRYNITKSFMDMMDGLSSGILSKMENLGVIISGSLTKIAQDPNQKDQLLECYDLVIPYPCNYIDVTLVVVS